MTKSSKFLNFLDKLQTKENANLLESIKKGFLAVVESRNNYPYVPKLGKEVVDLDETPILNPYNDKLDDLTKWEPTMERKIRRLCKDEECPEQQQAEFGAEEPEYDLIESIDTVDIKLDDTRTMQDKIRAQNERRKKQQKAITYYNLVKSMKGSQSDQRYIDRLNAARQQCIDAGVTFRN